nr:MAG TPA: hypothetical protein [Crassvirales sp.]
MHINESLTPYPYCKDVLKFVLLPISFSVWWP